MYVHRVLNRSDKKNRERFFPLSFSLAGVRIYLLCIAVNRRFLTRPRPGGSGSEVRKLMAVVKTEDADAAVHVELEDTDEEEGSEPEPEPEPEAGAQIVQALPEEVV